MKIMINGQEIKLPSELMEMASNLMPMLNPSAKPQVEEDISCKPLPMKAQQHVVHKIVHCKDMQAREIIIDLNQRISKLEELLAKKTLLKDKKRIISKTKGKSKVKIKEKPRKAKKKIGKKK